MPTKSALIMGGKDKKYKAVKVMNVRTAKKDEDVVDGAAKALARAAATVNSGSGFLSNIDRVRNVFLRSLAFIYFAAFLSLYLQIDGLYGTNGVTPVKTELDLSKRSASDCFKDKMTVLCFVPGLLGLDSQRSMELVALVGVVLSAMGIMCVHFCVAPVMATLWALYLSLYNVGNVFMWFQWDILLLEAGVLGIISAPFLPTKSSFQSKPSDLITNCMVKWLLFRLMFASGVVKLASGCPTWWGLTALTFHFETQCLPTPLAWYAHNLPSWILKLGVVGTYFVEIIVPFMFFAPFGILKCFSFWTQVLFQLSIMLTGNYNFFNMLTVVLCTGLLDGDCLAGVKKDKTRGFSLVRVFVRTFSFTLIGLSLFYTWKFFGLSISNNTLQSKLMFRSIDFNWFISMAVPYSMFLGAFVLISTILHALVVSILDVKGGFNKTKAVTTTLLYGVLCAGLFLISVVPYSSLHKETNQHIPQQIRDAYADTSKFHLSSSYGLFRRMTGTDGGRPEVVLEHSNELNGTWSEYEFLYKPGDVSEAPRFLIPHQPRLDWQMWFAALATYHDNPWLVSLSYRLLEGQPSVMALLDTSRMPKNAPKYVRGTSYKYKFTSSFKQPQDWWTRKKDKEYLPTYSVNHEPLVQFIKKLGYLDQDVKLNGPIGVPLANILDLLRSLTRSYRPEYVIWSSVSSLLAVVVTAKMF